MFNIYLFLYIHQHTFIYIYIYIYIGIDIYINIYLLIYTYNFTYIYICIYTCYHILCGTLGIYLFILIFWFIDEPHPRALIIRRKKYLVHRHKNKNKTCWKSFFITHSTYLRAKKKLRSWLCCCFTLLGSQVVFIIYCWAMCRGFAAIYI